MNFKEFQKKKDDQGKSDEEDKKPTLNSARSVKPKNVNKSDEKELDKKPPVVVNSFKYEKKEEPSKTSRSEATSIKTELLSDNNPVKSINTENSTALKNETTASAVTLDSSVKSKKLDDLFETLKELEKEEKFASPPRTLNSFAAESIDTLVDESKSNYTINYSFRFILYLFCF